MECGCSYRGHQTHAARYSEDSQVGEAIEAPPRQDESQGKYYLVSYSQPRGVTASLALSRN